jgi:CRISPR-associated protein Cas6
MEQDLVAGMADLVFPVSASALPGDHAMPLQRALLQRLPWLADVPAAGVHQIKLASSGEEGLVSARARLLLRLPYTHLPQAQAWGGQTLDVQGHALRVGAPHVKELVPHGTLYAHAVASDGTGEETFMAWAHVQLRAMGLRMAPVCGKHGARLGPDGVLHTYSLMVHGLDVDESLQLLEQGLGPHRMLGCGLFVAHKSAAAVGA